jgi:hypothetical protein
MTAVKFALLCSSYMRRVSTRLSNNTDVSTTNLYRKVEDQGDEMVRVALPNRGPLSRPNSLFCSLDMLFRNINKTPLRRDGYMKRKIKRLRGGTLLTYDLLLKESSWNSGESDDLATRWASTRRQLMTGPYEWSFDTLWLANQTLNARIPALIGSPLICD